MKTTKKNTYLVPFSRIPYGSKIILYGGGKLGEVYFRKIKLTKRAEIVAIIDKQVKKLPEIFEDTLLCEPNEVSKLHFDYILIAVEDIKIENEIRHFLHTLNITDNKIICTSRQDCTNGTSEYEIIKCFERNMANKNRRFFLFMLPEHGNLGDYAIGYAELSFFKQYFGQYDVYGVTTSEWLIASEFFLNIIKPNDVIFINGGGFLGDLWGDSEIYMPMLERFPKNIKIFLPNTLTYCEKPNEKNAAFMKDIEWFKGQENLFTFFREYSSYHMFEQYEKRSYLFPDMAFFLHNKRKKIHKNGNVLLCLRNDCEKIFTGKEKLESCLKNNDISYDFYDINTEKYISQQAGKKLLDYTVQLFQFYDCIITDRLHGMILAVISNVPCVAFDNYTNKISGVFELIKDLEYVKLITEDEINNISQIIDILYERKLKSGDYQPPIIEFEKMANKIKDIIDCVI